jgi:predicted phosphoribosyltransferase
MGIMALFNDRFEAGKKLAKELSEYTNSSDVLILAIPRGGVPVAFEVAKELNVKMDVCVVRKLGVPGDVEIAMGAIASDNIIVLNEEIVRSHQITKQVIDAVASKERIELERRERIYRGNRPKPNITGLTVILIVHKSE